jgi:hypothetical protein
MTNLGILRVSLTKHGAHKIATLLKKYDRSQVLQHLNGSVVGVNIERAQALKNFSTDPHERLPQLWDDVRAMGEKAIDGLVLLAIISSHQTLLQALRQGAIKQKYKGRIERDIVLDGKAFTNFKHTLVELGYGTGATDLKVDYDFAKLFKITDLNRLAAQLLTLKLKAAKWNETNSLEDELIRLEFHKAFSIDEASFRSWILTGASAPVTSLTTDDEDFFAAADEKLQTTPFVFIKGHTPKKVGKVKVTAPTTDAEADLMHNAMQTKLYERLAAVHGTDCVGTENSSGSGTAIDLVVQTLGFRWFYEIKTADSVKACIRQAIPQLLEYAYWQCDATRAAKLIIVGPKPITPEGANYLQFLRETFNLQFYYEHCSV